MGNYAAWPHIFKGNYRDSAGSRPSHGEGLACPWGKGIKALCAPRHPRYDHWVTGVADSSGGDAIAVPGDGGRPGAPG
jgi:hypothetical protein